MIFIKSIRNPAKRENFFDGKRLLITFFGVLTMEERIQACLAEIRLMLQNDGGDLEFVGFSDGVVSLRFLGACADCPYADLTLNDGIAVALRAVVDPGLSVRRV